MKIILTREIPGYPKGFIFDSKQELTDEVMHSYILMDLVKEGWAEPILEGRINSKHLSIQMKKAIIYVSIFFAALILGSLLNTWHTNYSKKHCVVSYACAPENLCCGIVNH